MRNGGSVFTRPRPKARIMPVLNTCDANDSDIEPGVMCAATSSFHNYFGTLGSLAPETASALANTMDRQLTPAAQFALRPTKID